MDNMNWLMKSILVAALGFLALAGVFKVIDSFGHEAPSGWNYPLNCCSNTDCRVVNSATSKVKVYERDGGYVISTTGEFIAWGDKKRKNSPDGLFHWCSAAGLDTSGTICLFVPPPAY